MVLKKKSNTYSIEIFQNKSNGSYIVFGGVKREFGCICLQSAAVMEY